MAIKLLFFAQCAEWMECREKDLALPAPSKLLDLLRGVPQLAPILPHLGALKVAVNEELTDFNVEVRDGDEVALMPPFSGG